MSKSVLIATLAACLLAVVVIAVLTATVIADGSGSTRVVYLQPTPVPGPGQRVPGPRRGIPRFGPGPLRACLQKQGIAPQQGTAPDVQKLRQAMKDCLGTLPTPVRPRPPAPLPNG